MRKTITEMTLDDFSAILITARLKFDLSLREIKDVALKSKMLRKEKSVKQINTAINEIDEGVDAVNHNKTNFRVSYRGSYQNTRGCSGFQPARQEYKRTSKHKQRHTTKPRQRPWSFWRQQKQYKWIRRPNWSNL